MRKGKRGRKAKMVSENKYFWSNPASQVEDFLSSHSHEDWGTAKGRTHSPGTKCRRRDRPTYTRTRGF